MKLHDDGSIEIRKPDDFHVHLRSGEMMEQVLPFTARAFKRALVMPNLRPEPITGARSASDYAEKIRHACDRLQPPEDFEPLMTIQITDRTTLSHVAQAAECRGIILAAKVYPVGATTNSDNGVTDFKALHHIWAMMEHCGLALCLHGEIPTAETLERERAFIGTLDWFVDKYPKLKITLEHVSTAEAIRAVERLPKTVGATVTLHHLLLTLDDLLGPPLRPHLYCRPPVQRDRDREAIRQVVLDGNPKFFFGSDSAPHTTGQKECAACAAGVFTAPVLLPLLAEFFEDRGALERLEPFVSEFGARHYGLSLNRETITLKRGEFFAPGELPKPEKSVDKNQRVTPFRAGEKLRYQLA
jgi:dihydroorotase